ncbi:phosphoglycerate kinase [Patescibacteria group bacterium]
MRLKTLNQSIKLKGQRVLVRIDANVPIKKGKTVDGPHGKIARVAVDLEWLSQHGARIIVMTHLGRPGGKRVPAYSVRPVAKRLSELLGRKIPVVRGLAGGRVEKAVSKMKDGEIVLLENVRFDARENRNSTALAQELARLADLFVNDAFSVSHRPHTSVDAITSELPSYAGPLVVNEVSILEKVSRNPKKPFLLLVGGYKIRTKLPLMKQLLPQVDKLYLGGAIANTFYKAQGREIGLSLYEKSEVKLAGQLLKKWGQKILLPEYVVVAKRCRKDARIKEVAVDQVPEDQLIIDLGPKSLVKMFKEIDQAKTIIWNGPFGNYECLNFATGSIELARKIATRTGKATTVLGGGDTVVVSEMAKVADRFSLLSTGGGAMLQFLANQELPGLEALKV